MNLGPEKPPLSSLFFVQALRCIRTYPPGVVTDEVLLVWQNSLSLVEREPRVSAEKKRFTFLQHVKIKCEITTQKCATSPVLMDHLSVHFSHWPLEQTLIPMIFEAVLWVTRRRLISLLARLCTSIIFRFGPSSSPNGQSAKMAFKMVTGHHADGQSGQK